MTRVKSTLAVLGAATLLGASGLAQAGATLDAVKSKGFVQCGISDGLPGFSYADAKGEYKHCSCGCSTCVVCKIHEEQHLVAGVHP